MIWEWEKRPTLNVDVDENVVSTFEICVKMFWRKLIRFKTWWWWQMAKISEIQDRNWLLNRILCDMKIVFCHHMKVIKRGQHKKKSLKLKRIIIIIMRSLRLCDNWAFHSNYFVPHFLRCFFFTFFYYKILLLLSYVVFFLFLKLFTFHSLPVFLSTSSFIITCFFALKFFCFQVF